MNNRLSIQDLALILSEQTGKSTEEALRFLQEFIAVVSEGVYNDKLVKVKGLGTFKIIRVEERASVSVNSGERFVIPSHYKFTFTPDKELKELVNKPFSLFDTVELNEEVDFSDVDVSAETSVAEDAADDSSEEILPDGIPEQAVESPQTPEPEEEKAEDVPAPPVAVEQPAEDPPAAPEKKPKQPESSQSVPIYAEARRKRRRSFSHKLLFPVACLIVVIVLGVAYIVCLSGRTTVNKDWETPLAEVGNPVSEAEEMLPDSAGLAADSVDSEPPVVEDNQPEETPKSDILALVTIKAGDRLASFAKQYYGHKFFWVYIYEYNKDIISDPNNIPIGTELRIPNPGLYGIDSTDRSSIDKAAALQSQILSKYGK